MKVDGYKIVASDQAAVVEAGVNQLMSQGYEPFGQPHVVGTKLMQVCVLPKPVKPRNVEEDEPSQGEMRRRMARSRGRLGGQIPFESE